MPALAQVPAEPKPEVVKVEGPIAGLQLGLLHYAAPRPGAPTVLALHGQVLPHEANMGFPIGGRSLLGALAATGLDVWAMDYYGFGASDRYPEMNQPANAHAPLGQAEEAADQVAAAIKYLRTRNGGQPVMLLGDSGGTIIAGVYAARQPGTLSKLVIYGPVTPFSDGSAPPEPPAYVFWAPKDLWSVFTSWAGNNPGGEGTLDQGLYDRWAIAMLDSDPTSRTRNPPSIKIPNGRLVDQFPLVSGRFLYDLSRINVPTLILMGETDTNLVTGGQWMLKQLRNAPHRRLVVIGNGSHTAQFESERSQVYQALAEFLHE
jgi:pimeloyl-ACP methyl ester carboxylesterase